MEVLLFAAIILFGFIYFLGSGSSSRPIQARKSSDRDIRPKNIQAFAARENNVRTVSVSLSDVLDDKREFWYFWLKARTGKSRKVHISYGYKGDDLQNDIVSWGICGSMMDSNGFDIVDFPKESDICKRCFKSDHPGVQGLLQQYQRAKAIQMAEVDNVRP